MSGIEKRRDAAPESPDIIQFTQNEMDAALCLWEYCLSEKHLGNDDVWDWLRGGEGAANARDMCIWLAEDLDKSYQVAHGLGYDMCFDWDFVPKWTCLAIELTMEHDLHHEWVDYIGRKIYHEFRLGH